jgi:hypothetical protein
MTCGFPYRLKVPIAHQYDIAIGGWLPQDSNLYWPAAPLPSALRAGTGRAAGGFYIIPAGEKARVAALAAAAWRRCGCLSIEFIWRMRVCNYSPASSARSSWQDYSGRVIIVGSEYPEVVSAAR